jgi:cytochrome c2
MQHANMLLRVIVQSPADFRQMGRVAQKLDASDDSHIAPARATFLSLSCVNCHTVSGTAAAGTFGPDLSHLMGRETLGSGVIPNTPENLRAWVKDPQVIKPGNLMPNMQLNSRELDAVCSIPFLVEIELENTMATTNYIGESFKETEALPMPSKLHEWIVTVDHKRLGIMYIATALFFFAVAASWPR